MNNVTVDLLLQFLSPFCPELIVLAWKILWRWCCSFLYSNFSFFHSFNISGSPKTRFHWRSLRSWKDSDIVLAEKEDGCHTWLSVFFYSVFLISFEVHHNSLARGFFSLCLDSSRAARFWVLTKIILFLPPLHVTAAFPHPHTSCVIELWVNFPKHILII